MHKRKLNDAVDEFSFEKQIRKSDTIENRKSNKFDFV